MAAGLVSWSRKETLQMIRNTRRNEWHIFTGVLCPLTVSFSCRLSVSGTNIFPFPPLRFFDTETNPPPPPSHGACATEFGAIPVRHSTCQQLQMSQLLCVVMGRVTLMCVCVAGGGAVEQGRGSDLEISLCVCTWRGGANACRRCRLARNSVPATSPLPSRNQVLSIPRCQSWSILGIERLPGCGCLGRVQVVVI